MQRYASRPAFASAGNSNDAAKAGNVTLVFRRSRAIANARHTRSRHPTNVNIHSVTDRLQIERPICEDLCGLPLVVRSGEGTAGAPGAVPHAIARRFEL